MSRIEINAGSRHVIIEHDGELEPLRAAALNLWQATDTPQTSPGPAVGFTSGVRWTPDVRPPVNARVGYGGDGLREGP